jgi:hypothetical protein
VAFRCCRLSEGPLGDSGSPVDAGVNVTQPGLSRAEQADLSILKTHTEMSKTQTKPHLSSGDPELDDLSFVRGDEAQRQQGGAFNSRRSPAIRAFSSSHP